MYVVVVIVFAIFFLWIIFDLYKHILKSGKYEMIKHEHSILDFFWIIFFGKEFPLTNNDHNVNIEKDELKDEFMGSKKEKSKMNKNKKSKKKENKKEKVDEYVELKEKSKKKNNPNKIKNNPLSKPNNSNPSEKEQSRKNNRDNRTNKNVNNENKNLSKSINNQKEIKENLREIKNNSSDIKSKEEKLHESRYLIQKIAKEIRKVKNKLKNDKSKEFEPGFHYKDIEINTLKELSDTIRKMPKSDFKNHVNKEKNDFLNWIRDVVNDEVLVKKLSDISSKKEIYTNIKIRYYYFIYLKIILKKAREKIKEFKESDKISKDMGLIDLVYDLEISPFDYGDFLSEVEAIVQYLELAKIQNVNPAKIDQSILNMGFNKILIDVAKKVFNN